MMNNPTAHNKNQYAKLNKSVKYEVKKWKRTLLDREVEEMELEHAKNNSHELFKRVRKLAGEKNQSQIAAKNKDGILKTAPADVMKCWEHHFKKHLNTRFPRDDSIISTIPDPEVSHTSSTPFTPDEVEEAIKSLKKKLVDGTKLLQKL